MNNQYRNLEIDSPIETYDVMRKHILQLKDVKGMSCEIGLRRGGGTKVILDAFIENNDRRTHICVDPYGNIIYYDIVGAHRSDYTDDMRNETLCALYKYTYDNRCNVIFFNLEDSEFYRRFCDGVPVYDQEKKITNEYSFVHIDGQHDLESVDLAANFFAHRINAGGIIMFDNTNHYDHEKIHNRMLSSKFELLEIIGFKAVYRRII